MTRCNRLNILNDIVSVNLNLQIESKDLYFCNFEQFDHLELGGYAIDLAVNDNLAYDKVIYR